MYTKIQSVELDPIGMHKNPGNWIPTGDGCKGSALCNTSALGIIGVWTTTRDSGLEKTYPYVSIQTTMNSMGPK